MRELQISVEETIKQRAEFCNVSNTYIILKKTFDVAAAALGILIFLPVFVLIAIAIKLESPGTIFFFQERTGLNGKIFKMMKFRSMVADAELRRQELEDRNESSGHMFKIKEDPRMTRVGKIIRKTSMDELPQLFNIIKGEMSIVGPRPPIVGEVAQYDVWHKLRLSVKPGLTGLWQVSGRSNIGFEEMVRLDLKYIRERGIWYDLKIILKTVPALLGDSKAF